MSQECRGKSKDKTKAQHAARDSLNSEEFRKKPESWLTSWSRLHTTGQKVTGP